MSGKKQTKPNPAQEAFQAGRGLVALHPVLGPLMKEAEVHFDDSYPMAREDWLWVTSYGDLYANSHRRADPQEWAYAVAHGLLHLALGHIHQCSGLQREGNTFWAYPGCPEGRGFDETGDKGVLYIEAEPGNCTAEFVPLCRRRYQILEADVTGGADPLETARAVLAPAFQEDVCRLVFTGERGAEPLDLERLAEQLLGRCWALSLRDRTRAGRDLWARMEEDSLTGLFLRSMAARCRKEPDNDMLQQAVRFGLAALENREEADK